MPTSQVCVMAVGGYGRKQLCPQSDLDIMLLHSEKIEVTKIAESLWYPIWDAGISLDHSVRSLNQVVELAQANVQVFLGLLNARFVVGDQNLAQVAISTIYQIWNKTAYRHLDELGEMFKTRQDKFGEIAFLLEPDLKESRGGLRDVHSLEALLLLLGSETIPTYESFQEAFKILLSSRVELHKRSGRHLDRLLLQEQDGVAKDLNFQNADDLMLQVSKAGRAISWFGDELWRKTLTKYRKDFSRFSIKNTKKPYKKEFLGVLVWIQYGEAELDDSTDFSDPCLILKLAVFAAQNRLSLSHKSLRSLFKYSPPMPEKWPIQAKDLLVELLGIGPDSLAIFEALDQSELLVRILPEWEFVRSKPQRNAYHRFTVDRHLCETVSRASKATSKVKRPDLLLFGSWLHDLGKGLPGDHSVVGAQMIQEIGTRIGFNDSDINTLVKLVRHHLLLADVATRRDLDDPATVEKVAELVEDSETLQLLNFLTEADAIATGPSAWGPWKARLVDELVYKTQKVIEGHSLDTSFGLDLDPYLEQMSKREVFLNCVKNVGDTITVIVIAPDRTGLLAKVAGTFALQGLNVHSANAAAKEGMAVEIFEVEPSQGISCETATLKEFLLEVLRGEVALDARLEQIAVAHSNWRRPQSALSVEEKVELDNISSEVATIVEVRAQDRPGTLYRITSALSNCQVDVKSAKVSTLGNEVIDSFYITEIENGKILDPNKQALIKSVVLSCI